MIFDKVKDKINEEYVRQEAKKTRHEDITETLDNQEEIDKKMSTAGVLKKYTELGKLMVNMLKCTKQTIH